MHPINDSPQMDTDKLEDLKYLSFDLHLSGTEIQKQPNFEAGCLKVIQQLSLMLSCQSSESLQLQIETFVNQDISIIIAD